MDNIGISSALTFTRLGIHLTLKAIINPISAKNNRKNRLCPDWARAIKSPILLKGSRINRRKTKTLETSKIIFK